jgi:hypothetical protein
MTAITPKQFTIFFLFIATLLAVSSCCTKKYCVGADDMNEIRFYNFAAADLDTVMVKRFAKSTGFVAELDSTTTLFYSYNSNNTMQIVQLTTALSVDFDYKVELASTGQTFTLSDFTVKQERCNTGFACNDHYTALVSYKVNGQPGGGGVLEIRN